MKTFIYSTIFFVILLGYEYFTRQIILKNIQSQNQPIELSGIIMPDNCYEQLVGADRIMVKILK